MKKRFAIIFILAAGFLFGGWCFLAHNKESKDMTGIAKRINVREPAVAGQFYPFDKEELVRQADGFLDKAEIEKPGGAVLGLVVPHAGYEYSGQVAAWGFKQLKGKDIDTVILIGNSHSAYFSGAAVYQEGYFKTPLGEVEIDAGLAGKIINEGKTIKADMAAHEKEHSLEVEIPFLQRMLKNFRIVPILMGKGDLSDVEILARAISRNIVGKNILLVASSDLSHYPIYEDANYADKKTAEAILSGDVNNLEKTLLVLERKNIANAQTFLCAKDAVEVLMLVMKESGAEDIRLLNYANSGDSSVERSQVVGYGAIAFYGGNDNKDLTEAEQQKLLEIAKKTVESYVKTGQTPNLEQTGDALNRKLGVFVTLKKGGELRGCIGNFAPLSAEENGSFLPLWQNVQQTAVAAAAQDPRFLPLTEDELTELDYEISVLSPLQKIDDWRQIQLGKHGVEIKNGSRSGLFLPQVAIETGWDLETFMGQLCSQKAGLDWDCWKEKDTEIYTFTAQIF